MRRVGNNMNATVGMVRRVLNLGKKVTLRYVGEFGSGTLRQVVDIRQQEEQVTVAIRYKTWGRCKPIWVRVRKGDTFRFHLMEHCTGKKRLSA